MKKVLLLVFIAIFALSLASCAPEDFGYTWDEILGGIDTTQTTYSLHSESFKKVVAKGDVIDTSKLSIAKTANNETELIPASAEFSEVSSTLVRERLARGESLLGLVSPEVEKYILENKPKG